MVCQSTSPETTAILAEQLVSRLTTGGTILLSGELGAGKTTFVQGLARALGVEQNVTSPTFVLLQSYPTTKHAVIKTLIHVDLYRLTQPEQLASLDLNSIASDPSTLLVIEWPERNPDSWPNLLGTVEFTTGEFQHRRLTMSFND